MGDVFNFFTHIAENYGTTFAVLFLLIILILFGFYFIVKTFPNLIKDYIEKKVQEFIMQKDFERNQILKEELKQQFEKITTANINVE